MQAKDLMNSPVVSVPSDTPLREVARLLTEQKISGALVTDRGAPVGVVSLVDMVAFMAGLDRPPGEPGGFYRYGYPRLENGNGWSENEWEKVEEEPVAETQVGEVMATNILTVNHEMSVENVGRMMLHQGIHRVFVVKDGTPVGVISTMDVMRAFVDRKVVKTVKKPARVGKSRKFA